MCFRAGLPVPQWGENLKTTLDKTQKKIKSIVDWKNLAEPLLYTPQWETSSRWHHTLLSFHWHISKSPSLGCKQTVHLKASARHANCRSTSWRSDWQKHQHATWLNVLEENQNTDSSTPNSTTLCTAVLTEVTGPTYCICKLNTLTFETEDRCLKAVFFFLFFFFLVASQAAPPSQNQMMGQGASASSPTSSGRSQL